MHMHVGTAHVRIIEAERERERETGEDLDTQDNETNRWLCVVFA